METKDLRVYAAVAVAFLAVLTFVVLQDRRADSREQRDRDRVLPFVPTPCPPCPTPRPFRFQCPQCQGLTTVYPPTGDIGATTKVGATAK